MHCRNPACEYHHRPLDGFPLTCPTCNWPVLGSMVYSDESDELDAKLGGAAAPAVVSAAPAAPPKAPPESKQKRIVKTRTPAPETPRARSEAPPPPKSEPKTSEKAAKRWWMPGFREADETKTSIRALTKPSDLAVPPSDPGDVAPKNDPGRTVHEEQPGSGRRNRGLASYRVEQFSGDTIRELCRIVGRRDKPLFRMDEEKNGTKTRTDLLRFRNTESGLEVIPLDELNGVYLALTGPKRVPFGTRLMIGDFVIECREGSPSLDVPPLIVGGTRFWALDLRSLAGLRFIRPDGLPGLEFPLFKPTVIGRPDPATDKTGGKGPDLPLDAGNVSRRHARISPFDGGVLVEDLGSRNRTFVRIEAPTVVNDGAVLRIGDARLRVVRID